MDQQTIDSNMIQEPLSTHFACTNLLL